MNTGDKKSRQLLARGLCDLLHHAQKLRAVVVVIKPKIKVAVACVCVHTIKSSLTMLGTLNREACGVNDFFPLNFVVYSVPLHPPAPDFFQN
jgi:hypothetical protein